MNDNEGRMDYKSMLKQPDSIAFLVVQGTIVFVVLYAIVRQFWNKYFAQGVPGQVKRGDKSWGRFLLLHGLLLLLMFQLVSVAEIAAGYRVIICLFNFVFATYLTLGNGWFRNKSLGWMRKIQDRPEM